jgi:hypothetical protein
MEKWRMGWVYNTEVIGAEVGGAEVSGIEVLSQENNKQW